MTKMIICNSNKSRDLDYDVIGHWNHLNHNLRYCGWLNIRGVLNFVVFMEGPIHEFKYSQLVIFCMNYEEKYYGHKFLTPQMCHFHSTHENWYPQK